jgi:hypothetical protein
MDNVERSKSVFQYVYIKSCSHEVAKHKSGRGNMPIPCDGTTFSHNIKEDGNAIRTNGKRPRWITSYQKTSIYKSNVQVSNDIRDDIIDILPPRVLGA